MISYRRVIGIGLGTRILVKAGRFAGVQTKVTKITFNAEYEVSALEIVSSLRTADKACAVQAAVERWISNIGEGVMRTGIAPCAARMAAKIETWPNGPKIDGSVL